MAEFIVDPAAVQAILQSPDGPVAQYLARTAQLVTDEAKRRSPVDTGRLRASITWQLLTDDDGLFARVGTDVHYAGYVHDGVRGRIGRPFLREALDEVLG